MRPRGRLVLLGYSQWVEGFIRGNWVYLGAPCGVYCFIQVAGFIIGGRRVHPASLGLLVSSLGFVGFLRGKWVHSGTLWGSSVSFGVAGSIRVRTGGCRVHSVSLVSLGCALGVWFIQFRWVHSGAPWRSSVSLWCILRVIGFILGRWVHRCAPWPSSS